MVTWGSPISVHFKNPPFQSINGRENHRATSWPTGLYTSASRWYLAISGVADASGATKGAPASTCRVESRPENFGELAGNIRIMGMIQFVCLNMFNDT